MDAIMCATMATSLAELRHYYSHDHHMDRQSLVRIWLGCHGHDTLIIMSLERCCFSVSDPQPYRKKGNQKFSNRIPNCDTLPYALNYNAGHKTLGHLSNLG